MCKSVCKGSRGYRYYVSEHLIDQKMSQDKGGLRIPTSELETAVLNGLAGYLSDHRRLMDDLSLSDAVECSEVLKKSEDLVASIAKATPQERTDLIYRSVERVVVTASNLRIKVRREALGKTGVSESALITVPVRFQRCGLAVRLVVDSGTTRHVRIVDQRLVSLIDRKRSINDVWR